MEKNKPVKVFKAGAVRASVFENEKTNSSGEPYASYRVVIEKRYKDSNDVWKSTHGFAVGNELPKAVLVMQKAYEYVVLQVESDEESNVESA